MLIPEIQNCHKNANIMESSPFLQQLCIYLSFDGLITIDSINGLNPSNLVIKKSKHETVVNKKLIEAVIS